MSSLLDDGRANPSFWSSVFICLNVLPLLIGFDQSVNVKIPEEDAIVRVNEDVGRSNATMMTRIAMKECKGTCETMRPIYEDLSSFVLLEDFEHLWRVGEEGFQRPFRGRLK